MEKMIDIKIVIRLKDKLGPDSILLSDNEVKEFHFRLTMKDP